MSRRIPWYQTRRTHGRATSSANSEVLVERVLPIGDLLIVQFLTAVGLVACLILHRPGWYGAAAGLVVGLLLVVRVRGLSVSRWVLRQREFRDERHTDAHVVSDPFDATLPEGARIGFRWDGTTLMSVVRIQPNPHAITVMEPGGVVDGEQVPMAALADCLRQHDVDLDSIDVISHGARCHGDGLVADLYDDVLGPLPASARRSVWVVVRFAPAVCPDAVRRRGPGWEGIVRTTAAATRRVANRLSEAGLRTEILTAAEIGLATNELMDGVRSDNVESTRYACHDGRMELRTFSVPAPMLSTTGLAQVWTTPSHSTTLCLSLRRSGHGDAVELRGLARFDSYTGARTTPDLALLQGRQRSALQCTLPVPPPRRPVGEWSRRRGGGDALRDLMLPASGCGQVVGADDRGRAVALHVFGAGIERVEICGTVRLAKMVVLRSLALGARVRVHTTRADAWGSLVSSVGDSSVLHLVGTEPHEGAAGSNRNHSVEVFDGVNEQTARRGVTTVLLRAPHTVPSQEAQVVLHLLDPAGDVVRVRTPETSTEVSIVATADEMLYVDGAFQ